MSVRLIKSKSKSLHFKPRCLFFEMQFVRENQSFDGKHSDPDGKVQAWINTAKLKPDMRTSENSPFFDLFLVSDSAPPAPYNVFEIIMERHRPEGDNYGPLQACAVCTRMIQGGCVEFNCHSLVHLDRSDILKDVKDIRHRFFLQSEWARFQSNCILDWTETMARQEGDKAILAHHNVILNTLNDRFSADVLLHIGKFLC